MPILPNSRRERFAQEVAKGKAASEAYRLAGYAGNDATLRACGSRLLAIANVAERVAELQAKAAAKAEFTLADMIAQIDEDREFAVSLKHASAAVAATLGKAKLLGFDRVRLEHTGANGGPIEHTERPAIDVIEGRLATVATRLNGEDTPKPTEH